MPKKNSYITVTDQFCGSGGSSQGAQEAGVEIKLALNHWKLAIETHNTNFPNALHDCTDISASDPRRYPSTDILITSPECTNHSLAKGVKIVKKQMDMFASGKMDASAERSRATMWDVPRFAEYHKYNAIIVENVVDARKWVMFDAWLQAMFALGYMHRCVYLNSMHCHPTPQSRDRMYVVFWKKGNKAPVLDYTPAAHCPRCGTDIQAVQAWKKPDVKFGKYRQQYVYCCPADGTIVEPYYYASFNCIDWSDIGQRIGDRAKPLAPNSITRIQYGLDKYGDQPLMVVNYSPGYTKPVTSATGTMTTTDSHGLFTPFLVDDKHTTGIGYRVMGADQPVNTVHTGPCLKVVMPSPFIVKLEYSQRDNNVKPVDEAGSTQNTRQSGMLIHQNVRGAEEALQTQTTCQGMGFVTPPILTISRGKSKVSDPIKGLNTVSAGGIHTGLVTDNSWNSFIASYYNGSNCTKHISQETGSITTNDRLSLVSYKKPNIEDCYYRMFKPAEIKTAMAFGKDYVVLGNGRDQVKQLGNAVTPPAMKWLTQQVLESLS